MRDGSNRETAATLLGGSGLMCVWLALLLLLFGEWRIALVLAVAGVVLMLVAWQIPSTYQPEKFEQSENTTLASHSNFSSDDLA